MRIIRKFLEIFGMPGLMSAEDLVYLAGQLPNSNGHTLVCGRSGTVMPLLLSKNFTPNTGLAHAYEINNYANRDAELPYSLEAVSGITSAALASPSELHEIIAFGLSDNDLLACALKHNMHASARIIGVGTLESNKKMSANDMPPLKCVSQFSKNQLIARPFLVSPKSIWAALTDPMQGFLIDKTMESSEIYSHLELADSCYTPVITELVKRKANNLGSNASRQARSVPETHFQVILDEVREDQGQSLHMAYLEYRQRQRQQQRQQQRQRQMEQPSSPYESALQPPPTSALASLDISALESHYGRQIRQVSTPLVNNGAVALGYEAGALVLNAYDSTIYLVVSIGDTGFEFRRV